MFSFFSKHRFHESLACATLISGSITLHVMWISHLLVVRSVFFRNLFSVVPAIGPISGLYLKAVGIFFVVFLLSVLYWKGKDCSHQRKHLLTFFLFSTLIFFVMTLPFVYSFSITVE